MHVSFLFKYQFINKTLTSKRVQSVLSQNASDDYNFRQTCLEAKLAARHDNTYRIINDLIN